MSRCQSVRIGIFSAPMPLKHVAKAASYLKADYIRWVELSGAVPVIIPYNLPKDELLQNLMSVNGLVWVGGAIEKSTHSTQQYRSLLAAYRLALQFAIQETNNGNPFPIWGTCLGFDFLATIPIQFSLKRLPYIQKDTDGTLQFMGKSRLASFLSPRLRKQVAYRKVTHQYHRRGLDPDSDLVKKMTYLKVVSVDKSDVADQTFVNMFEYNDYPFYGSQWHPEVPDSELSLELSRELSRFFYVECSRRTRSNWQPASNPISSKYTVLLI